MDEWELAKSREKTERGAERLQSHVKRKELVEQEIFGLEDKLLRKGMILVLKNFEICNEEGIDFSMYTVIKLRPMMGI